MTLLAPFAHCDVGEQSGRQAAASSLEKPAAPASRWNGPCCVLSLWHACVPSEEFTTALGSPSSSLSVTASLQMWSFVFLQLCLARWSPGVPLPGSFHNAQWRVGHNALLWTGGRKWRMLLT